MSNKSGAGTAPRPYAHLHVCSARIELTIPGAVTLKDRRAVVKSLIERMKARFNVSASDLDGGSLGAARAAIGVAAASNRMGHAEETVRKTVQFMEEDGRAEVGDVEIIEL